MILPFLHERKIYLNQIELSHKWFYYISQEGFSIREMDGEKIEEKKRNLIFAVNFTKF